MSSKEQTLSIIKPDAVERNLSEKAEFYKVHQSKPFYDQLCGYLSSGPIEVMILEGENAVSKNRELMGATDPKNAKEGTIRKLYGVSIDKNSVHGSDSIENAKIEINFFFDR
jgi:nucleoside-diphosphate kinase